ncbi:MAG TPA: glycerate kinase [Clostridiaceae bacterium]|nr:glycerate kinase [Clostridiaceae bacterium]
MKIIIASDSYKGSLSSSEVADACEAGIKKVIEAEIVKMTIADGGEGTVDALVEARGGSYEHLVVSDPIGRNIKAKYGVIGDAAVIEMAAASGLTLLKEDERNPLITTTYGTGQLIKGALDSGCRRIYIGIGGSATNDGGMGMAQALGVSFTDMAGNELGNGGGELSKLYDIDIKNLDPRILDTEIIIISDVTNPLCGEKGASNVYGPQKGADKEMIKILDNNLLHYSNIIRERLNKDILDVPGSGAAGGLGGGLIAILNAKICRGIETVLDLIGIDEHLKDSDLVITGEGKIDGQSIFGKVPVGVGKRAMKYNVPAIAIVGSVGEDYEKVYEHGINAVIDIVNRPMKLSEAVENASCLIEKAAENAMRIYSINRRA